MVSAAHLIGIDYHGFLCLLMNAGCTNSKLEHSKKYPKDLSPSNRGRLLSIGALMFQIQVKA